MNFNLFSVIAASAISATVALPASANVEISDKKTHAQSYTQKYLQQSANFYAALDHKTQALKDPTCSLLCRSDVTCRSKPRSSERR